MSGAIESASVEEQTRYRVQVTEEALGEIRQGWEHLRGEASETIADEWEESLKQTILDLQLLPHRYARVTSRAFRGEVRQYTHRRKPGTVAYHVLYYVDETTNGPRVVILAVRHAARKPFTRKEAASVEQRLA